MGNVQLRNGKCSTKKWEMLFNSSNETPKLTSNRIQTLFIGTITKYLNLKQQVGCAHCIFGNVRSTQI